MVAQNKIAFNEVKAELDKEGKKAWKADFTKKKKRKVLHLLYRIILGLTHHHIVLTI